MKQLKRMIAIVCGGDSSEHDVSLRSAQGLYSFFDKERYKVYIVDIKGQDWHVELPDGTTARIDRNDFSFVENGKVRLFDYAYITIHGTPGENGILQGYFDLLHIPYSSCSLLVAAMTFDKFTLNQYLKGYGVKVAESVLLRKDMEAKAEDIVEKVGLPCFVKPNGSGSSFGVTKCETLNDIVPAIENARQESDDVMVESMMVGMEIANGAYRTKDGSIRVLPITEVVPKTEFFDYDAKYNGQVEEITPARLPDETTRRVQALTSAIYDVLGADGIMRMDYIITKNAEGGDVVNLLEINATPGMTQTSFIPQQVRAAGLDMTSVLSEIIENKLSINEE